MSVCLAAQDRTKQGEPNHAQGANLPIACLEPFDSLLPGEHRRLHGYMPIRSGHLNPDHREAEHVSPPMVGVLSACPAGAHVGTGVGGVKRLARRCPCSSPEPGGRMTVAPAGAAGTSASAST